MHPSKNKAFRENQKILPRIEWETLNEYRHQIENIHYKKGRTNQNSSTKKLEHSQRQYAHSQK